MRPPAFFFHQDAIEGADKDLVGRRAAGQSFLKGYLAHMPGDEVHGVTQHAKAAEAFDAVVRGMGETRPLRVSTLRGAHDFTEKGAIVFPGPGFLNAAWRRQRFGPARCSLIGVTHTVSTRRVVEGLHRLMLEPVEDWDAIICTSRAVRSVVARQMELEADMIRERFGATRVPMPQLPVIPLGIQAADFAPEPGRRDRLRQAHGVPEDGVVIMTMGRLTSVEKANPAPLMIALEQVAQATGRPLHLWLVGWPSREEEAQLHRDAARALAPSVTLRMIDGRAPEVRRHIWAGADVFTLPVDNIQETFGLVPVEAMAAGLPVVMPDWNGFRDTVVPGETGMLIPTSMPGPGSLGGARLAERFGDGTDDYLRYLSLIQHQTAIDIPAYVAALTALVADPDLRARMGAAGQAHVAARFDWSAVIPHYLALSEELAARRKGGDGTTTINPMEVDPFDLYQRYATAPLAEGDRIVLRRTLDAETLTALDAVNGRTLYNRRILPDARLLQIADSVAARAPATVGELMDADPQGRDEVQAVLLFLAKYDFVAITPQGQINA